MFVHGVQAIRTHCWFSAL